MGKTFLAIGQGKIVVKQANPARLPWSPICSKSSPHRMSCLKSKKNIPSSSNVRQELACKEECLVTLWVFICCLTRMLPSYYTSSSVHFLPSHQNYSRGMAHHQTGGHLCSSKELTSTLFQQTPHKGLVLLNQANDFYRFFC